MGGSQLDMLNLNDSKVDLFMYFIEGIMIGTWKVQHLTCALFLKTTLTWLAWGYTWLSPYDPKFGDKEIIEVSKNDTNLLGHKANDYCICLKKSHMSGMWKWGAGTVLYTIILLFYWMKFLGYS